MVRVIALAALAMTAPTLTAASDDPSPRRITLENGGSRVEISPQVGGRILSFTHATSPNFIFAPPAIFDAHDPAPEPGYEAPWIPFDGHTVWVAPQKAWWSRNHDYPHRVNWPPDPWLEYGRFEITGQSASTVTLRGPVSPLSGVQLTKHFEIDDAGTMHLVYTLANSTDAPVTWGLWSNTRVDPHADIFVPVAEESDVVLQLAKDWPEGRLPLEFEFTHGFVHSLHRQMSTRKPDFAGKLQINPAAPLIAAFLGDWVFLKRASEITPPEQVAPTHAFIEIFTHRVQGTGYLELEMHGRHRAIPPGESLEFRESWQILPVEAAATPGERLESLPLR